MFKFVASKLPHDVLNSHEEYQFKIMWYGQTGASELSLLDARLNFSLKTRVQWPVRGIYIGTYVAGSVFSLLLSYFEKCFWSVFCY